jgi:hypothetical protein
MVFGHCNTAVAMKHVRIGQYITNTKRSEADWPIKKLFTVPVLVLAGVLNKKEKSRCSPIESIPNQRISIVEESTNEERKKKGKY